MKIKSNVEKEDMEESVDEVLKVGQKRNALTDLDNESGNVAKKIKIIETSNGPECQLVIRNVLTQSQSALQDTEIHVDHQGEESMEDLLKLLFEAPSDKAIETARGLLTSRDDAAGRNNGETVMRNVFISTDVLRNTSSECDGSNAENKKQLQFLVNQLQEVEGFENEDWGRYIEQKSPTFFPCAELTEQEKDDNISQLLTVEVHDSTDEYNQNGKNSEATMSGLQENGINKNDTTHGENSRDGDQYQGGISTQSCSANSAGNSNLELNSVANSTVTLNSTNYASIDLNKLPAEEITSNFILEYVLSQASAEVADSETKSEPSLRVDELYDVTHYGPLQENYEDNHVSDVSYNTETEERVNYSQDTSTFSFFATSDLSTDEAPQIVASDQQIISVHGSGSTVSNTISEQEKTCAESIELDVHQFVEQSAEDIPPPVSDTKPSIHLKDCRIYVGPENEIVQKEIEEKLLQLKQRTEMQVEPGTPESQQNFSDNSSCSTVEIVREVDVTVFPRALTNDNTSAYEEIEPTSSQPDILDLKSESMDSKDAGNDEGRKEAHLRPPIEGKSEEPNTLNSTCKKEPARKMPTNVPQLKALMKREMEKAGPPDMSFLSAAMEKTFKARSKDLLNPNFDLSRLLKNYPALNLYPVVKEEFRRVNGGANDKHLQNLEEKLSKYFNTLRDSKKKQPGSKRHPLWEETLKTWRNNSDCDSPAYKVLGMLALCFHLAENSVVTKLCKFISKSGGTPEPSKVQTPTIVLTESQLFAIHENIWIYVDGERYLQVPNFYEAVLCVYAIYYILNIDYNKSLKKLFEYFDSCLGIKQSTYSEQPD